MRTASFSCQLQNGIPRARDICTVSRAAGPENPNTRIALTTMNSNIVCTSECCMYMHTHARQYIQLISCTKLRQ